MNEHTRSTKPDLSVTVEEAEARILELLRRAEAGERIEVTRNGKPVAELGAPGSNAPGSKLWGAMRGELWMSPDFDELGPEWDEYVK